eukprot:283638-Lingulodinium_polyedra.AAC.2
MFSSGCPQHNVMQQSLCPLLLPIRQHQEARACCVEPQLAPSRHQHTLRAGGLHHPQAGAHLQQPQAALAVAHHRHDMEPDSSVAECSCWCCAVVANAVLACCSAYGAVLVLNGDAAAYFSDYADAYAAAHCNDYGAVLLLSGDVPPKGPFIAVLLM